MISGFRHEVAENGALLGCYFPLRNNPEKHSSQECLRFLDQRKQTKMQWVQDPNQNNVDNLNNVRPEANRHCRNKKKEYVKAKIDELDTNCKTKHTRNL